MSTATPRICLHCGARQRIEETLQRDFDGVLEERISLQVAMREAIQTMTTALAALDRVVENHPAPVTEEKNDD